MSAGHHVRPDLGPGHQTATQPRRRRAPAAAPTRRRKAFTPRAAERMRSACVDVITELVDRHASAGHCDFVADIAGRIRFRSSVRCSAHLARTGAVLRLGRRHRKGLRRQRRRGRARHPARHGTARGLRRGDDRRRRRSLTDDLISELIRAEDDGDRLTHDELVNLAVILLHAGTDTTRNQLAAAVQVWPTTPTSGSCSPTIPNWRHKRSKS